MYIYYITILIFKMSEKKETKDNIPAKTWVFTIFKYTDETKQLLRDLCANVVVFGEEICPTTNEPHLQTYITFTRAYRFSQLVKLFPKWNFEKAKVEDWNYCLKDMKYEKIDRRKEKGTRTDLIEIKDLAKQGRFSDIMENFPSQWLRYEKGIRGMHDVKNINLEKRNFVTEVIVYWGKAGSGKTRRVYEESPNVINLQYDGKYFDGYQGEDEVLLDDFQDTMMPRKLFLNITDRIPMNVRILGSWVNWRPKKIFITSNFDPNEWYEENDEAVLRRLTKIEKL